MTTVCLGGKGPTMWDVVLAACGGLLLLWLVTVVVLLVVSRRHGDPVALGEMLRLVPDLVRLLGRLAADPALPYGVRVRLALVMAYLLSPIDLVPDFVPVLGYADDAVIVALALRWVARSAGVEALDRHWTGSPQTLVVVKRLAGLASSCSQPADRRPLS